MAENYLIVSHLSVKDITLHFSKIEICSEVEWSGTPCWLWTGKLNADGYARVRYSKKTVMLHRLFYAWLVAPVPAWKPGGLTIDHKCRRRNCCNPVHLEIVHHEVNMQRSAPYHYQKQKTHCPSGHSYSKDNLGLRANGYRYCLACHRKQSRVRVRTSRKEDYARMRNDPVRWQAYLDYMKEFHRRKRAKV